MKKDVIRNGIKCSIGNETAGEGKERQNGPYEKGKYAPPQNEPTTARNGGGIQAGVCFPPHLAVKEVCQCGLVAHLPNVTDSNIERN